MARHFGEAAAAARPRHAEMAGERRVVVRPDHDMAAIAVVPSALRTAPAAIVVVNALATG